MDSRPERKHILIVDDDSEFVEDLKCLVGDRYRWSVCYDFLLAEAAIRKKAPDLVLLDIGSPTDPEAGFAVLSALAVSPDSPPVIMLTAAQERDTVVQAIAGGASDFVNKRDLSRDLDALHRKIETHCVPGRQCASARVDAFSENNPFGKMIVVDPKSRRLHAEISRIAPTPYSVLIYGETGTGKEHVAGTIHALSSRSAGPMRTVNCAAVPDELLEAVLFGNVPGAYTGATTLRHGEFELAANGTLFLDEISAASTALQTKLLRVLETGDYQRLGSSEVLYADVRVIAATNRDPHRAMAENELAPDFYFRVADYELHVPALRERPGDILPLAYRFLAETAREAGRSAKRFSRDLELALLQYKWPGNIRQLRQEIRRAVLNSNRHEIGMATFFSSRPGAIDVGTTFVEAKRNLVDDFERRYVAHHLAGTNGCIQEAARIMGLTRQHFHRLVRKHRIDLAELKSQQACEDS